MKRAFAVAVALLTLIFVAVLHQPTEVPSLLIATVAILPPSKAHKQTSAYSTYFPRTYKHRSTPLTPRYRETFPDAYTGECFYQSKYWSTCDAPQCSANKTTPLVNLLPITTHYTAWNQTAAAYIQSLLRKAWGKNPPMIDMYVRAGCRGGEELAYLYQTLALFWPQHLGDLIVVLDWNDKPHVDLLVNREVLQGFSIHVVFEHQPCLPGRLFNQYSYLNLYRYSTAEFVVTIDSDCVLHRPVTPDVLFNSQGELILPTSAMMQPTRWHAHQQYFTGIDERAWGHAMVSQPVAFKLESFQQFLSYVNTRGQGKCYEQMLVEFYERYKPHITFYCWMCQLGAYVAQFNKTGYEIHKTDTHNTTEPYLRYASHVSYEKLIQTNFTTGAFYRLSYYESIERSTFEGLCFWFGVQVFPELCAEKKRYAYLLKLLFRYTYFDLAYRSTEEEKHLALQAAKDRLHDLM